MEKYHKTDIAPVEQENERDESYPANNPQIDCARTRNNYNVIKRQCSYTQHINKRIAELDLPTKVRVGKKWNLQRGKEGSTAKHLDTMSYKVKKMKDEAVAAVLQASEAERRKEAAEKSQAHVEQTTLKLEEKREQLLREVAPLQAAADVAQEYNAGKRKPNKKDVPALAADNARLRKELEYSIKDQHDVFQLYQNTERERLSLQEDAKTLRELREQAPDKLREALATAEQRKAVKRSSPFKSSGNGWSK